MGWNQYSPTEYQVTAPPSSETLSRALFSNESLSLPLTCQDEDGETYTRTADLIIERIEFNSQDFFTVDGQVVGKDASGRDTFTGLWSCHGEPVMSVTLIEWYRF